MPRKGEYRRSTRPVDKPASLPRVGIRAVSGWQHAKGFRTIRLDPAQFTCSVLAGELADEWIAGQVITAAQQRWLAEAVTGPTVLTSDGEAHLDHAQAPATVGLSTEQIERLRSGAMDMGVSSCRDPLDSPFGRPGQPCPVAPLRCLECRHAVVLPSNLPQLLLLADHLETLRRRVTPQHFHALWGQSHANLTAVLGDRTDAEIALARKQIDTGEATLHLPLSARVEFDR